jgi:hypothetical protein
VLVYPVYRAQRKAAGVEIELELVGLTVARGRGYQITAVQDTAGRWSGYVAPPGGELPLAETHGQASVGATLVWGEAVMLQLEREMLRDMILIAAAELYAVERVELARAA